ncbi:MAG: FtsW/RodA/SpoVE family cell cycle protein [bacterium]
MKVLKPKGNWNFNRNNTIFNYDWWLVACICLMCVLGLAFLASSLSTRTQADYQKEFFKQLLLGVGLGGIGAFILSRIDYHFLLKKSDLILKINFILLGFIGIFAIFLYFRTLGMLPLDSATFKTNFLQGLSFLPVKPVTANGAIRWIDFPFIPNFQPSEFSKIAILLYFSNAFWLNENSPVKWMTLKRPLYSLVLSAFLILIQPDLGTVVLIIGIILSSMWTNKIPFKIIFYIGFLALAVALASSTLVKYRAERVNAFFDPNSTSAAQIQGVQNAIRSGGMWGKGYGNSTFKQRSGILIEQSTDAIISIIGEEAGYFGTLTFLSLYGVFLWRALKIANEAPDSGGRSLATGIGVWIVAQAVINISGNLGLLPLKGIPLPFVSQGGSSMMINLLAVGILLNISRQKVEVNRRPALKPAV